MWCVWESERTDPASWKRDISDGGWIMDCEWYTRGRVIVPPPTAGSVSYSVTDSSTTVGGGEYSGMESSQSTTSNEPRSSSPSKLSSSSGSSARSARPIFRVKRRPKDEKTLFVGRPSGRRPYVGSKFSSSGLEEDESDTGVFTGGGTGDVLEVELLRAALDTDAPDIERARPYGRVPRDCWRRRY